MCALVRFYLKLLLPKMPPFPITITTYGLRLLPLEPPVKNGQKKKSIRIYTQSFGQRGWVYSNGTEQ